MFIRLVTVFSRNLTRRRYVAPARTVGQSVRELEKPDLLPKLPSRLSELKSPFVFTIATIGGSYSLAAILQYEEMRRKAKKRAMFYAGGQRNSSFRSFTQYFTDGQRVVLPIVLANLVVFGIWKITAFRSFAVRYLVAHPGSAHNSSMIFSVFSHYNPAHIFCNMFVLWSFSDVACQLFGKYQFYATYISGGVLANLGGHIGKVLRQMNSLSLGASGALMTILGAVCTQYPNQQLAIMFLPFFTFSAGTAIKSLIAMDSVGLALGWKLFDHAAHLAGALFGIFYVTYGHRLLWDRREVVVKQWHKLRNITK